MPHLVLVPRKLREPRPPGPHHGFRLDGCFRPHGGGARVRVFFSGGFHMALSWLHRLLKRKSRPVARTARKQFGPNRFMPSLEALGDRIVPSTFHVTTLADGGAGSLR